MNSTLFKPDFAGGTPGISPHRGASPAQHGPRDGLRRGRAWLARHLERLRMRPVPPLVMELTDRFVGFRSLREFEFALASRTEFPASRVREIMALSPEELERRAARIRTVERHFASVLALCLHEPELTGELFRELELMAFSEDHGWRGIMEALMRLSPEYDPYKRIALIKYMQYLRARQNLMRTAFLENTRDDDMASLHAARPVESIAVSAHADTATFDTDRLPDEQPASAPGSRFVQLPKGETVALDLGDVHQVDLLLAGNRVRLYTGRENYMVDDDSTAYPLHAGKNLVGRHSSCDVVLDPACRAISRTHLMVEPVSASRVLVTDLSSHGTEVPAEALSSH